MTDSQQKPDPGQNPSIPLDRYARQMVFSPIGPEGQKKLKNSTITLIGCGALGSQLAEMMTRAGIGCLRIVDRDYIELTNLQRQTLFDENDLAANLPKAEAAASKLRHINSEVEITPFTADVNPESIEHFINSSNLLLDGTDNLQTRFLINDIAVKHKIPWIYGACLAAAGMSMFIPAGGKPCFRCLFESPPEPGQLETCETAGILGPTVALTASFQAAQALKLLTGNEDSLNRNFFTFDLWENRFHQMPLDNLSNGCICCSEKNFEFLAGKGSLSAISLCGRNSVQIRPRRQQQKINLNELSQRLKSLGNLNHNEFMLRLELPDREIAVFPDARAIIKGTNNIDEARSLYSKYIGH